VCLGQHEGLAEHRVLSHQCVITLKHWLAPAAAHSTAQGSVLVTYHRMMLCWGKNISRKQQKGDTVIAQSSKGLKGSKQQRTCTWLPHWRAAQDCKATASQDITLTALPNKPWPSSRVCHPPLRTCV
jgi:hypothetical protein